MLPHHGRPPRFGISRAQAPHLLQINGDSSIAVVSNGSTVHFFDYYAGSYHARFYETGTLTHDTLNGLFVATDGTGQTFTFYDFSGGTPAGRTGTARCRDSSL